MKHRQRSHPHLLRTAVRVGAGVCRFHTGPWANEKKRDEKRAVQRRRQRAFWSRCIIRERTRDTGVEGKRRCGEARRGCTKMNRPTRRTNAEQPLHGTHREEEPGGRRRALAELTLLGGWGRSGKGEGEPCVSANAPSMTIRSLSLSQRLSTSTPALPLSCLACICWFPVAHGVPHFLGEVWEKGGHLLTSCFVASRQGKGDESALLVSCTAKRAAHQLLVFLRSGGGQ